MKAAGGGGVLGQRVDVAYAVRFLVSDEAAMVQGVTLPVAGSPPPAWWGS